MRVDAGRPIRRRDVPLVFKPMQLLDLARHVAPNGVLRDLAATAHAMSNREHAVNDMQVRLPFRPVLYAKVLSNPGFWELQEYICLGKRPTWPRIEIILDRSRLSRRFGTHISLPMRRSATKDKTVLLSRAAGRKS